MFCNSANLLKTYEVRLFQSHQKKKKVSCVFFHDVIHFHTWRIQTPVSSSIINTSAIKTEVLFILRTVHNFIEWKYDGTNEYTGPHDILNRTKKKKWFPKNNEANLVLVAIFISCLCWQMVVTFIKASIERNFLCILLHRKCYIEIMYGYKSIFLFYTSCLSFIVLQISF